MGRGPIIFEYFGLRLYNVRVNFNRDTKPSGVNVMLHPEVNLGLILDRGTIMF